MNEIMILHEAGEYLDLHVRTIYHLTKKGEIPGRKVGGRWKFEKDVLDKWFSLRENENPS